MIDILESLCAVDRIALPTIPSIDILAEILPNSIGLVIKAASVLDTVKAQDQF